MSWKVVAYLIGGAVLAYLAINLIAVVGFFAVANHMIDMFGKF